MNLQDDQAIPSHPLNIKPSGNAFGAARNAKSSAGLFARLPDEIWVLIMDQLDAFSLLRLGLLCKAFYAFSHFEDFWKTIYLRYRGLLYLCLAFDYLLNL